MIDNKSELREGIESRLAAYRSGTSVRKMQIFGKKKEAVSAEEATDQIVAVECAEIVADSWSDLECHQNEHGEIEPEFAVGKRECRVLAKSGCVQDCMCANVFHEVLGQKQFNEG